MSSLEIVRRDARRAALRGLVDSAGLFPPAELSMAEAVAEYREARTSSEAWMVERFICPASRLEELFGVMTETMTAGEKPWSLAVPASSDWLDSLAADSGAVRTFTHSVGSAASVDLVEIKVPAPIGADPERFLAEAAQVLQAFQAMVFFELPWETTPDRSMDSLDRLREESGRALGVKLRCGGLSADLFPSPGDVARFIEAAATRALPLKATAGLHHALRHLDPETGFHHHGFVNVLAAAALAQRGETDLVAVLADEDPASFTLTKAGLAWRDFRVAATELEEIRRNLFVSYGSCSFAEPVEDLEKLGILPVETP